MDYQQEHLEVFREILDMHSALGCTVAMDACGFYTRDPSYMLSVCELERAGDLITKVPNGMKGVLDYRLTEQGCKNLAYLVRNERLVLD